MLKYLPLVIGSLAIGGLALAFAVGCTSEPTEQPDDDPQLQDAQACSVPSEPSAVALEPTPHVQSPEEALAQDRALTAEGLGWTIEQAEAQYRASEALDPITARLAAERLDIFIGSALSTEPGGPPQIYIKGPADDFVRNLVVAAGIEIEVVDNQPYSRDELEERKGQVVRALQEWGFASFSAGADIQDKGQIEASVVRQTGLPDDPDEILASLPAELRKSVTLTVSGGSPPGHDFGPLAVIEGLGGDDALGGTGCVRIDDRCVTMTLSNGETLLLVWHASEVRWDEEDREITFSSVRGSEPIKIRDGDIITVGGAGLGNDVPVERDLLWLSPPHESCTGEPWAVSEVLFN